MSARSGDDGDDDVCPDCGAPKPRWTKRRALSFLIVGVPLLLANLVAMAMYYFGVVLHKIQRGEVVHVVYPIIRLRRWIAGEPAWHPHDLHYGIAAPPGYEMPMPKSFSDALVLGPMVAGEQMFARSDEGKRMIRGLNPATDAPYQLRDVEQMTPSDLEAVLIGVAGIMMEKTKDAIRAGTTRAPGRSGPGGPPTSASP